MMAGPRLRLGQLWRLAWRDAWHERWLTLCAACLLAAMLSPLWTLWGLEHGVVGTLIDRQDRDPLMRQMLPTATGNNHFDAAWLARVRAWPGVAFVVPTVRSAASQLELFGPADTPVTVDVRATAPGDPLLGGLPVPVGATLVLSAASAKRLKAVRGTSLRVALSRQRNGNGEAAVIDVTVADLLPLAASEGITALAPGPLLESVEAWRDGYQVPGLAGDGAGPPPARTSHPSFRLYAGSIREVGLIAARLEAEGVSVLSSDREIEGTLGLQRNLRAILALVGTVTLAGAVVALSALQVATVARKRHDHALLKLTGHGRAWLLALPCANAVGVALAGGVLALAVYAAGAAMINRHFAAHLASGEAAVRLGPLDIAAGFAAVVLISMLPALVGGWHASKLEPADELRDP